MGKFSDSVKLNSGKMMKRVNLTCYKIVDELFRTVVNFTPSPAAPGLYAKGVLANQWYPSNGVDFSTMKGTDSSPNALGSLTRIKSIPKTEFLLKDGSVTMTNNMEYAYRAEMLGWPSPKWSGGTSGGGYQGTGGPYRMVARAMQIVSVRWK